MDFKVTSQNIIDANWAEKYLSSAGEVESLGFCSPVVQLLRKILPTFIAEAFLPKADIFAGAAAYKGRIVQFVKENPNAETDFITKAAAKINDRLNHFATKQPERSTGWMDALINVKELIALPTTTRVEEPVVENQPVVEQPVLSAPTPSNTQSTPEDEQVVVPTTPQETQTVATPEHDDLPEIADLSKFLEEQEVPVQRDEVQENVREVEQVEDPTPAEAQKLSSRIEADKARVREEKRQAKAAEKAAKKAAEAPASAAAAPKKHRSRKHRTDSSVTKK